jgi:hypothetical protein
MSGAVFSVGLFRAQMGCPVRHRRRVHPLFYGLRIHALVHAPAETTSRGTLGNFLPPQRPSSAAPSLHGKKFQRRPAAGGLVSGYLDAAFQSCLCASPMPFAAQCSTARFKIPDNREKYLNAGCHHLAEIAARIFAGFLHAENFTQRREDAKKFLTRIARIKTNLIFQSP